MKVLGFLYIILYCIDAAVSVVASFIPNWEALSGGISQVAIIISLAVFVLALLNKLIPKNVFLTLSGYYMGLVVFGIGLGVMLAFNLGPDGVPSVISLRFLREQFSWYWSVHWLLLIGMCGLATYGLSSLSNTENAPTERFQ